MSPRVDLTVSGFDWFARSSGSRLQGDAIALALQGVDGAPAHALGVAAIVVVGAQVVIGIWCART
jgi:hypothetical protein